MHELLTFQGFQISLIFRLQFQNEPEAATLLWYLWTYIHACIYINTTRVEQIHYFHMLLIALETGVVLCTIYKCMYVNMCRHTKTNCRFNKQMNSLVFICGLSLIWVQLKTFILPPFIYMDMDIYTKYIYIYIWYLIWSN